MEILQIKNIIFLSGFVHSASFLFLIPPLGHGTDPDCPGFPPKPPSAPDFQTLSQYFLWHSGALGAMEDTAALSESYGELIVTAKPGVNVLSVLPGEWDTIWGVDIEGPASASVVINMMGTQVCMCANCWTRAPVWNSDTVRQ